MANSLYRDIDYDIREMTRDEKLHRALEILEEIDLDVPVLDGDFMVVPIRNNKQMEIDCDTCDQPIRHNCYENSECYENLPKGECCIDSLEKQVGEICFKYDVAEKYAKVLVEIIRKEREKYESMYIHR